MDWTAITSKYKVEEIFGRYLTVEKVEPLLRLWNKDNQLSVAGSSVMGLPIYSFQIGSGKTRILIWSQMHGNESTTTKALLDLLLFLNSNESEAHTMLNHFTLLCIPILNPDGAKAYTRENANGIDLNRDAQNLSQPESISLRTVFEGFQPDYCYNMHDQRTIFGVASSGKPATVSFLSPAFNEKREFNRTREKAVHVINGMNAGLQKLIPGQVGRFDDAFNLNCVGDTFQSLGVPTILFEAGHYQGDYTREITRKHIFHALLSSFSTIYENVIVDNEIEDYLRIPQNKVVFFDIVYKNVKINYDGIVKSTNFAIQYREELFDNQVLFVAYFAQVGSLEGYFGHFEYDAKDALYHDDQESIPRLGEKANFDLGYYLQVVNGLPKV